MHRDRGLSEGGGAGQALGGLAGLRMRTGDYPQAAQLLEQALSIWRRLGDRSEETAVLNRTADVFLQTGEPCQALDRYRQALELARAVPNPLEEAHALAGAGRCAVALGLPTAPASFRLALEIFQRIGAAEATELAAAFAP
jgi:tetratricopeptide (TPR) repeat protein